jgi:HAD superfamily hydrolase (TIGR01509 family)
VCNASGGNSAGCLNFSLLEEILRIFVPKQRNGNNPTRNHEKNAGNLSSSFLLLALPRISVISRLRGFRVLRHFGAMKHPKAVLLDFDGVIVDTEWAIYEAWRRHFEAHGHPLPLSLYNRCIGSDFDTWSPKTHLEDLTGRSFDWHQIDADRQVEIRASLEGAGSIPGVVEALEHWRGAGVPMAVVSSSSHRWVDGWLERLALTRYFRTTVCRGDAPRIKPAPDLYLEAARRLAVPPADCLVIEDSLNGLRSAKAAGMNVWIVPNRVTECLDFSEADHLLDSLAEIPPA